MLGTTFRSAYDVLLKLHYTFYLGRVGELLAAIFAPDLHRVLGVWFALLA